MGEDERRGGTKPPSGPENVMLLFVTWSIAPAENPVHQQDSRSGNREQGGQRPLAADKGNESESCTNKGSGTGKQYQQASEQ